MECSMPGFPVLYHLPELALTCVHWVSDAIQPSHPLSSPSPASIFPSNRVFSNESVLPIKCPKYSASASILPVNIQDWFPLGLTGLISLQSKGLSRVFSNTTAQKYRCSAFFMVQLSHLYMTTGKTISSVQSLSCVQLFVTPWTAACQASLSFTISWSLLKLTSIETVMPSNYFVLCRPLLLLLSVFPRSGSFLKSQFFTSGDQSSFSFSISPSSEYSGLISFRMDWFDLLAVQGTLKSLLQHPQFKSINSSALSLLNGLALTAIHDYWKSHSFD